MVSSERIVNVVKPQIKEYDTSSYPFQLMIARHFRVSATDLPYLDRYLPPWMSYSRFKVGNDQETIFHDRYYEIEKENPKFLATYDRFIEEQVVPLIGGDVVYQRFPTFRCHMPNNVAVGGWHRDTEYNHPPGEINFWMPFTKAWDSNTIWLSMNGNKDDASPKELRNGQYLMFEGSTLHGNKVNDTGLCRVSMDFRVIPADKFMPGVRESVSAGRSFTVGDYYYQTKGGKTYMGR